MTDFNYIDTVPAAPNDPSVDQPNMLINTQSIEGIIAVDHQGFNTSTNEGGYHTVIHQDPLGGTWNPVTRMGTPVAIPGVNQLLSLNWLPVAMGATTDTQLFAVTGNGGKSQLTGDNSASEGYVWSGGMLFQWGGELLGTLNHQTGSILFKDDTNRPNCIAFPTNCFIVTSTLTSTSSITSDGTISITTISPTGFSWNFTRDTTSSSNPYTGFYWFAVGQ